MSKINDGGPAFPHDDKNYDGSHKVTESGMSLRDWFAGQAMIALIQMSHTTTSHEDAKSAYQMADAMLKARETTDE